MCLNHVLDVIICAFSSEILESLHSYTQTECKYYLREVFPISVEKSNVGVIFYPFYLSLSVSMKE